MSKKNSEYFEEVITRIAAIGKQTKRIQSVGRLFAKTIGSGGVVHVYANGHSRLAVEELCVRMGALAGYRAILQVGLTSFTDVVGPNGIRLCQFLERVEGVGEQLLAEVNVRPGEPLLAFSATGTTVAAVDVAMEWKRRYPRNPLVVVCSIQQASRAKAAHSSTKTLIDLVDEKSGDAILDNEMPIGDTTLSIKSKNRTYNICPFSSIGALVIVQMLNEYVTKSLIKSGKTPAVLGNMHLHGYGSDYEQWISEQRKRYAAVLNCSPTPKKRH